MSMSMSISTSINTVWKPEIKGNGKLDIYKYTNMSMHSFEYQDFKLGKGNIYFDCPFPYYNSNKANNNCQAIFFGA